MQLLGLQRGGLLKHSRPWLGLLKKLVSVALGASLALVTLKVAAQAVAPARPAGGGEVRVVTAEERRDFYRTRGRELLGRTVHLHVEAEAIRRAPEEFTDQAGTRWVRFENRGVPLLIPARSPYWLQARRHLTDAEEFCLRGRVRLIPGDERQRACVEVTKIVRAPGSWR